MSEQRIATEIQTTDYLRERLSPDPRDFFYLSLSDLTLVLERYRTEEKLDLLDYGCGGSPYRSFFPNANYKRADFLQAEGDELDYVLGEDSRVGESDASFDIILSTQVAEHVTDTAGYFAECARLLRSGGRLLCSTHGYFPDHGCPYDFQRWTADGLRRDLALAGLEVKDLFKLTTGARAFFSIMDFSYGPLRSLRGGFPGVAVHAAVRVFGKIRPTLYRRLDRVRANERIVDGRDRGAPFYIGLFAVAVKP
jgi:SAM-dependent methyltransferase